MKAIIVVPTYNERENLPSLIREIEKQKTGLEVLFVDDNSPDKTGMMAEELAGRYSWIHVLHRENKEGLGRAYVAGFKWALQQGYEIIMQMDADLSHDPSVLPDFMKEISDHDAVFGSRYLKGVRVYNWSFKRLLISKLSNEFIRIMLRIGSTDTTTAYKCFKKSVLEAINLDKLKGRQNAFLIELVFWVYKKRFKAVEIPFMFRERLKGESKMRMKVALENLWMVGRLMLYNIALKIKRDYWAQR